MRLMLMVKESSHIMILSFIGYPSIPVYRDTKKPLIYAIAMMKAHMIRKLIMMVIFCWARCFSIGFCEIGRREPDWLCQIIHQKKAWICGKSQKTIVDCIVNDQVVKKSLSRYLYFVMSNDATYHGTGDNRVNRCREKKL